MSVERFDLSAVRAEVAAKTDALGRRPLTRSQRDMQQILGRRSPSGQVDRTPGAGEPSDPGTSPLPAAAGGSSDVPGAGSLPAGAGMLSRWRRWWR